MLIHSAGPITLQSSYGHAFGCCTQQGAFEFHVNFFGHTLRLEVDEERPCAKLQGEKGADRKSVV